MLPAITNMARQQGKTREKTKAQDGRDFEPRETSKGATRTKERSELLPTQMTHDCKMANRFGALKEHDKKTN